MYKITKDSQVLLDAYYNKYSTAVADKMNAVINGVSISDKLGKTKAIQVSYKAVAGGATHDFLCKYVQPQNLRKLLCGTYEELIEIVEEVKTMFLDTEVWYNKATKEKYVAGHYKNQTHGKDADGRVVIDHFNEIMRWIFADGLYGEVLNKKDFILGLDLGVCPYCGRVSIDSATAGSRTSTPPIDHYLPKSHYPFLAMSFHNLVPCCHFCNDMSAKGNNDPISPNIYLENPYIFDDTHVWFVCKLPENFIEDKKGFKVKLDSLSDDLKVGYRDWLKLEKHYNRRISEARDVFDKFSHWSKPTVEFVHNLGVIGYDDKKSYVNLQLGIYSEPSEELCYKFKRDLFKQLCRDYGA